MLQLLIPLLIAPADGEHLQFTEKGSESQTLNFDVLLETFLAKQEIGQSVSRPVLPKKEQLHKAKIPLPAQLKRTTDQDQKPEKGKPKLVLETEQKILGKQCSSLAVFAGFGPVNPEEVPPDGEERAPALASTAGKKELKSIFPPAVPPQKEGDERPQTNSLPSKEDFKPETVEWGQGHTAEIPLDGLEETEPADFPQREEAVLAFRNQGRDDFHPDVSVEKEPLTQLQADNFRFLSKSSEAKGEQKASLGAGPAAQKEQLGEIAEEASMLSDSVKPRQAENSGVGPEKIILKKKDPDTRQAPGKLERTAPEKSQSLPEVQNAVDKPGAERETGENLSVRPKQPQLGEMKESIPKKSFGEETEVGKGKEKLEGTAPSQDFQQAGLIENSERPGDNPAPGRVPELGDLKELFHKLTQQIQSLVEEKRSEVRLQLKPDYLGELKIKISIERGLMAAEFTVENDTVRQIIAINLPHLRTALEEQGADISQMTVNVDVKQDGFQEQPGRSSQSSNRRKSTISGIRNDERAPIELKKNVNNPWNQVDLRA